VPGLPHGTRTEKLSSKKSMRGIVGWIAGYWIAFIQDEIVQPVGLPAGGFVKNELHISQEWL